MKFGDIKGMPVVDVTGAATAGKIDGVFVDLSVNRAVGVRVSLPGLFSGHRVVPWSDMKAIGQNAVTLENADALLESKDAAFMSGALTMEDIAKMRVMTDTGTEVGKIVDVDLAAETGDITAYLLKEGMLDRMQGHEHLVPAALITSVGKDMIVINGKELTHLP